MEFITYEPLEALLYFLKDSHSKFKLTIENTETKTIMLLDLNDGDIVYTAQGDEEYTELQIRFYTLVQRDLINNIIETK